MCITEMELDILQLMALGKDNQQISRETHETVPMVQWYLLSIFEKLNVCSRTEAAVQARALRLLSESEDLLSK